MLLGLIVVGSVVLMVAGVGSPIAGEGGGSGPVFGLGSSGNSTTDLAVSVNESSVRPGEAVLVSVAGKRGRPVANATVAVAGEEYETNASGAVVVRFGTGGNYSVVSRKASVNDTDYRAGETYVTVAPREVRLSLRVNASAARVDEAVRATVRRRDTGEPVQAAVSVGGRTVRTDANGTVALAFATAGDRTLTASKTGTASVVFADASASVTVQRRVVDLRATILRPAVFVGTRPLLTVVRTDSRTSVNATVVVDGERYPTGPDGTLSLPALPVGDYEVVVRAPATDRVRFRADRERLSVSKRTVALRVRTSPSSLAGREATTVTVRRADTGRRVNATVHVGDRAYRTGADGEVTVVPADAGRLSVVATKDATARVRFERGESTVTVDRAVLVVDAVSVPESAAAGETLQVAATVANTGTRAGTTRVAYRVDGELAVARSVTVAANESVTVTLNATVPPVLPGSYRQRIVVRDGSRGDWLRVRWPRATTGNESARVDAPVGAGARFDAPVGAGAGLDPSSAGIPVSTPESRRMRASIQRR